MFSNCKRKFRDKRFFRKNHENKNCHFTNTREMSTNLTDGGAQNGLLGPPPRVYFHGWSSYGRSPWNLERIQFKHLLGQNLNDTAILWSLIEIWLGTQKFFADFREITGIHGASKLFHLWVSDVEFNDIMCTVLNSFYGQETLLWSFLVPGPKLWVQAHSFEGVTKLGFEFKFPRILRIVEYSTL